MTKAKYKVNSFFAGIGGFDLGFENQGFQTEYLCEINPFCNEVLSFHWPNVKKGTDICAIDESSIPVADVWGLSLPRCFCCTRRITTSWFGWNSIRFVF